MASGGSEASCVNDPNFAIICSFFEKFSSMINIQQPDIQLLQEWLENTDEVAPGLRELHVKLLRKMRKIVHETAWETALVKFVYLYSSQDAWEVERFGYKKSSLKVKLRILRAILEYQFQLNGKFRNKFTNMSAEELRSEPIGRDRSGHSYWLTQDPSCNFRIYQEHLDEEIWQVVASNRSEMETLITRLKGNEVVLPSLIGIIDEDSSSNSCGNTLMKPPPPEEQDDSQSSTASSKIRSKIPNLRIKLDSPSGKVIVSPNGRPKAKKEDEVEEDDAEGEEEADEESEEMEEDGEEEEEEEEEEEGNETEEDEKVEEKNLSTSDNRRERESGINGIIKADKEANVKIVAAEEPMEGVEEDGKDNDVTLGKRRRSARNSIQNGNNGSAEINGVVKPAAITNGRRSTSQRAKAPVVNQSKATPSAEVKSNGKRRTISRDAHDDSETEKLTAKRSRPTLLDNRCDKKSKYEKSSDEEEDDEDADDEEDAEEEADEGEEEVEDEEEEDEVEDDEDAEDDVDEEEEADEDKQDTDEPVEKEKKPESEKSKKTEIKEEKKAVEKTDSKDTKVGAKLEKPETKNFKTDVKDEKSESKPVESEKKRKDEKQEKENSSNSPAQKEETTKNEKVEVGEAIEEKVEVGEAIEEKVMMVQGEGSGKECDSTPISFFRLLDLDSEGTEDCVSEEIEEKIMYFYGEGSGMECLVGNQHEETSKNDSILLERKESNNMQSKDNLTTIPIKADKNENSESNDRLVNGADAASEKDGQSFKTDTKNSNNSNSSNAKPTKDEKNASANEDACPKRAKNSGVNEPTNPSVILEKSAKTVCPKSKRSASGNARGKCEKAESDGKDSDRNEDAQLKDESPKKSLKSDKRPEEDAAQDSKELKETTEKSVSEATDTPATIDEASVDSQENGTTNTRKRRLSEEKAQNFSESESELNSDSAAPPTEEDEDVGGKRLKMRPKAANVEMRKKVETARKSNERHSSTSEEETLPQDNNVEKPEDSDGPTDPLQISDNDLLGAKDVDEPSYKLPTPVLIQTRTTRHTPAGTPIKIVPPKGRGRKLAKNTKAADNAETLTQKTHEQCPIEEGTANSGDLDEEETEKVELQENGSSGGKGSAQRKPRSRKRDIETSNIIDVHGDPPVRQSRRIAQLKIREEAERRKMEEDALKKMKAEFKKKKKEEKTSKGIPVPESESEDTQVDSEAEAGKKATAKKKEVRGKNGRWSSGPEDEPEEDDEYDLHHDRYESERGSPLFKSDHEFSPESDIEDESQAVPLKRARTARKEGAQSGEEILDAACQKCGKKDHPEWILLCDKCDKGYHCSCLSPVLFIIPEGDWFCPPCQQDQLIVALEHRLTVLDDLVEQKRLREEEEARNLELEQKRKEEEEVVAKESDNNAEKKEKSKAKKGRAERAKRRRNPKTRRAFIADDDEEEETEETETDSGSSGSESSSEDTQTGSKSTSKSSDDSDEPIYKLRKRRQVNVSYRLNEYEDLINSAIKEEMDEVAGAGNLGRGKDISTIIEADKEEKLRQRKLSVLQENDEAATAAPESEIKEEIKSEDAIVKEHEEDEEEEETIRPVKSKSKLLSKRLRKKGRKLNNLDISSDDDGSDEDFKTSSYETDEDESISEPTDSDSSLEVYRKRGKKSKRDKKDRGRRPQRRAARERKRLDDFIADDDSDASDVIPKRRKQKRKHNWELQDTESEEDLSEQIDSEELCDDTTDSEDSDGCWRPSNKRRKTKKAAKAKSSSGGLGTYGGKQPRKFHKKDSGERSFKGKAKSKARRNRDTDESDEDVPRTRGKRFTYLDSFDEESSDDGIKPGVKRPDTPPEEREKFIKKQEEIKRMLAEKNTEAAKAVATPTLAPVDSLSTVPLSVIKGAKALDIDYLQRKGELNSDDDGETDFDEDLPDDFDPEAMDEEEIAKMMEEEDFAQQQLKLAGDVIRQKKKETEQPEPKIVAPVMVPVTKELPPSLLQEPPRKRLPMPTFHPPLGNAPRFFLPSHRLPYETPMRQHLPPTVPLSTQSVIQARPVASAIGIGVTQMTSVINAPPQARLQDQSSTNESQKPRGRRKKITPLRDTLQKQQAAAAAAAAASGNPSIPAGSAVSAPITPTAKEITPIISSEKPAAVGPTGLSVAQPPQLYTPPVSTPPSVITRMPQSQSPVVARAQQSVGHAQQQHGPQPRPPYPDQNPRFYPPPPNQMPPHRMSIIRHGAPMPQHHTLGPSFASGPPPLRPASPRLPASVGSAVNRQPSPRPMTFSPNDQYAANRTQPPPPQPPHSNPPPHAYRPPLYGTPGYPPAPPQQPQTPMHPTGPDYSAVSTPYGPTPYGGPYYPPPPQNIAPPPHATPSAPPAASVVPVSSAIGPASLPAATPVQTPPAAVASVVVAPSTPPSNPVQPVPVTTPVSAETSLVISQPPQSVQRPIVSVLETFDAKSRSPILETDGQNSPYSNSGGQDDNNDEENGESAPTESTSEFSGLVSYFSSQHDDLNS